MARVAVCQMTSGPDLDRNLDQALSLIRVAAAEGAQLCCLPENFERMASAAEKQAGATPLNGPGAAVLDPIRAAARELGLWVLAGSFAERIDASTKIYNTSALIDDQGEIASVYRKIHLFDVEIGDGAQYRESELVQPGERLTVAETPVGQLGLSICYDVRFPELYRELVKLGAELLAVPAAFTAKTGQAHWEVLLRARAIENQCFVVAPAQTGRHPGDRKTWGHAMIVDPWGTLLADAGHEVGVVAAEVNLDQLRELRRTMPVLGHRRL
jgi:predicted amidohydrolase